MGHLVGELVRRTTGKSLADFVAEEIAGPFDAHFQFGAKEADGARVAEIIPPPPLPEGRAPQIDLGSVTANVLLKSTGFDASVANTSSWRQAELGASNGHSNTRAIAGILSVISLHGQLGSGKRFRSPETIDLIFQEQVKGKDLVIGSVVRFGIGYALTARTRLSTGC